MDQVALSPAPFNGENTPINDKPSGSVIFIRYRLDGVERTAEGRTAWALAQLVAAGSSGVTPITHPGPRWSGYVLKLRKAGVSVETVHEKHGGAYAGHHAKYVLRSPVEIIESREAV